MYKLTPTLFNGTTLATDYEAKFLREHDPLSLVTEEPVETEIQGAFPVSPRSQPQSLVLPLYIRMRTTTQAALNAFKTLFDPQVGSVLLKATDDSAVTYRLTVKVINVKAVKNSVDAFIVRLYVAKPIFENDTPTSTPITANATPKTWDVAVAGTTRALPSFILQPTVAKAHADGYLRRRYVNIAWRSEQPGRDTNGYGYPVEINEGALDLSAEHTASRLLANGDDLRVLVDGVEVDRCIDNALVADYIWVNIPFKPKVAVTNRDAMTAIAPANGGNIELSNPLGTLMLPESGNVMWGTEVIHYASRTTTTLVNITRGARNSTAAVHNAATEGLWIEHDIQIVYDYTGAGDAPNSGSLRPVFNWATSTNLAHVYDGPFVTATTPLRTGQWLPRYTPTTDFDALLSRLSGGTSEAFRDTAPSPAAPKHNRVSLYVPCGVKAAGGAIAFTLGSTTYHDCLHLQVLGIPLLVTGAEVQLGLYEGNAAAGAKSITPTDVLSYVSFETSFVTLTGCPLLSDSSLSLDDTYAESFVLDSPINLSGWALRLKKLGAITGTLKVELWTVVSDKPSQCLVTAGFGDADLTTSFVDKLVYQHVSIPAGTYCLYLIPPTTGTGCVAVTSSLQFARGWVKKNNAGAWDLRTYNFNGFRILGRVGETCQPEAPSGFADEVVVSAATITFDNTTPRTPLIFVSPSETIFWLLGVLKNVDTGQTLTPSIVLRINDTLTIDCAGHTAIRSDTGENVPGLVTPSGLDEWLRFDVGTVHMSYTEAGLNPGVVVITPSHRDPWA